MVRVAVWWSARLGSGAEGVAGVECDVRHWRGARDAESGSAPTSGRCAIDAVRRRAALAAPRNTLHAAPTQTLDCKTTVACSLLLFPVSCSHETLIWSHFIEITLIPQFRNKLVNRKKERSFSECLNLNYLSTRVILEGHKRQTETLCIILFLLVGTLE